MAARNAAQTRQRLLDAAFAEFCAHGLAGARVDRIVAEAGVNTRMLYHYFGSKEGLFRGLLEAKSTETLRGRAEMPADLAGAFEYWQRQQAADADWTRLLMWEALAYGADDIVMEDVRAIGWRRLVDSIRGLQETGELPVELDAAQFQLSMIALVTFPMAFPQFTKMVTGLSPGDPAFVEQRVTFLRALAALLETRGHEATISPG